MGIRHSHQRFFKLMPYPRERVFGPVVCHARSRVVNLFCGLPDTDQTGSQDGCAAALRSGLNRVAGNSLGRGGAEIK